MPKAPISGLMTPSTTAVTIPVNAAPTTTATASSITFPRIRNSLNPLRIALVSLTALSFWGEIRIGPRTVHHDGIPCPIGSNYHRDTARRDPAAAPASSAAVARGTVSTSSAPSVGGEKPGLPRGLVPAGDVGHLRPACHHPGRLCRPGVGGQHIDHVAGRQQPHHLRVGDPDRRRDQLIGRWWLRGPLPGIGDRHGGGRLLGRGAVPPAGSATASAAPATTSAAVTARARPRRGRPGRNRRARGRTGANSGTAGRSAPKAVPGVLPEPGPGTCASEAAGAVGPAVVAVAPPSAGADAPGAGDAGDAGEVRKVGGVVTDVVAGGTGAGSDGKAGPGVGTCCVMRPLWPLRAMPAEGCGQLRPCGKTPHPYG